MKRYLAAMTAGLCLFLAGCSSDGGPTLGGRLLSQQIGQDAAADPRFVALRDAGAPLLLMGIEARQAGIGLVLETRRDGFTTWRAEDGVTVGLNRGMLSATRGFVVVARAPLGDLMSVDASQTQALLSARRPGQAQRFHSYLNGEGQTVFLSFVCDITDQGASEVVLNGTPRPARVMSEACQGPNDSFENTYWLGAANQILQSRQWHSPHAGFLQLQEAPQ